MDLSRLTLAEKQELLKLLERKAQLRARNRINQFYPDTGPLRRELYQKHLEFFRAGATYRERCFMAGNRIGKSEGAGAYETTLHLTGMYPTWWEGRRFDGPVRAWACGKTNETARDIVQQKLFGNPIDLGDRKGLDGTGLVPHDRIGQASWKQGVADLLDSISVRHVSGDWSTCGIKSYAQGRGSFEGTERDVIWLDEEPPEEIYGECIIRTATTNGIVLLTFTPLEGATGVVNSFLPPEMMNKLIEQANAAG